MRLGADTTTVMMRLLILHDDDAIVTLIFTYLIPIVPFILVLDGYVSAYRSREFEHVSQGRLL